MRRLSMSLMIAGLIFLLASDVASACRFRRRMCNRGRCTAVSANVPVLNLTAESARHALIEMLVGNGAPNFDTRQHEVAALKNGKNLLVVEKDADGILVGYWNCDVTQMRFSFMSPIGSCMYGCHGDFEYQQGRWTATVTGWSWAHFGPNGPP